MKAKVAEIGLYEQLKINESSFFIFLFGCLSRCPLYVTCRQARLLRLRWLAAAPPPRLSSRSLPAACRAASIGGRI